MRKLKKGSKPLPQNAILTLFFVKRVAFENEEEIRFLVQDATCDDDIVSVEIETRKVIESILFDPRTDHDAYIYHKEFIRDRFKISSGISHSSLYDPDRAFKD
jgi:hypothetical protein